MTFPLTNLSRPTVPPALTVTTTARIAPRPVTAMAPGSKEFRAALAEKKRELAALTEEMEACAYDVRRMERAEERLLELREAAA